MIELGGSWRRASTSGRRSARSTSDASRGIGRAWGGMVGYVSDVMASEPGADTSAYPSSSTPTACAPAHLAHLKSLADFRQVKLFFTCCASIH